MYSFGVGLDATPSGQANYSIHPAKLPSFLDVLRDRFDGPSALMVPALGWSERFDVPKDCRMLETGVQGYWCTVLYCLCTASLSRYSAHKFNKFDASLRRLSLAIDFDTDVISTLR